jgi:hypothetical protein
MRRGIQLQPHLTFVLFVGLASVAAIGYLLDEIPIHLDFDTPESIARVASWSITFMTVVGLFLLITCSIAAHALSGGWSLSVLLFSGLSAFLCFGMAMWGVSAHEDIRRGTGLVRTREEFVEGAMRMAGLFAIYAIVFVATLVWIATRGRRFRFGQSTVSGGEKPREEATDPSNDDRNPAASGASE